MVVGLLFSNDEKNSSLGEMFAIVWKQLTFFPIHEFWSPFGRCRTPHPRGAISQWHWFNWNHSIWASFFLLLIFQKAHRFCRKSISFRLFRSNWQAAPDIFEFENFNNVFAIGQTVGFVSTQQFHLNEAFSPKMSLIYWPERWGYPVTVVGGSVEHKGNPSNPKRGWEAQPCEW